MLELKVGRPEDTTGRLDKEIRVYDLLDSLGISYFRVSIKLLTKEVFEKLLPAMHHTMTTVKLFGEE